MGWTSVQRPAGVPDEVFFADSGEAFVATSSNTEAFYAAVRRHDAPHVVFCRVILKEWVPDVGRGTNFDYKELTEFDGPVASSPSRAVLAALTATDNEYAVDWRSRCAAQIGVGR